MVCKCHNCNKEIKKTSEGMTCNKCGTWYCLNCFTALEQCKKCGARETELLSM